MSTGSLVCLDEVGLRPGAKPVVSETRRDIKSATLRRLLEAHKF
jgi:hypothetical protein